MATHTVNGNINIPNMFFTINGKQYLGNFSAIRNENGSIVLVGKNNNNDVFLYFRNYLLRQPKKLKLTKFEIDSENFQKNKEKIQKIVKFTNSK
jgi:hypothetical protein|tara:strand:+ start:1729 stop:2010 length:282 start_codon:yes stop_codon:yes gene_type:complete